MIPIGFEGSNRRFEKPGSMTDEQCQGIDAFMFPDPNGNGVIIRTAWQPNKEDIEAVMAGRPIVLDIYSPVMIPVSIFTYDEKGEIN
jgi:hypothetical protein